MARTPGFAARVFTENERAYCDGRGVAADCSYAGRFAAKEAFLKALQTGWRGKISWLDVEIVSNVDGAPSLNITGEAQRLMRELGATNIHLSISHTNEHAIAQVLLEKR